MISVKNILKKENLVGAAGLGAGSLSAEVVLSKVAPMLPGAAAKYAPALPIIVGLVLSNSKGFLGHVGKGMIAQGVAGVAKTVIPADTKASLGIGGDVMMGSVMMGESLAPVAGYSSDSYDYTSAAAGEMSY
tara:strand:+ start:36 stop:431 length:396 start_codon:yes stop_codon:yes gene_type:complete